ncbi:MAG: hypothetical protein NC548_30940 [Lachnospiraceae bacterium]|nr:hypothetical protein [Lachnospiraceae bacterium]
MYQGIIKIEKTKNISIEDLYSLGKNDMGSTLTGHESVDCDYNVLNVLRNNDLLEKYYAPVKRVIRHKVTKPKWKIEDENGNVVYVTSDHSIMVLRYGDLVKVKPNEIDLNTDFLVSICDGKIETSLIETCEEVGVFDDEYVYDIEMNDDTHTFVANNILVHNSIYASFEQIIKSTDWFDNNVWRLTTIDKKTDLKSFVYVSQGGYPTEDDAKKYFKVDEIDTGKYDYHIDTIKPSGREFCLTLDRVFMHDFLKKIHKDYADKNGTDALLDFELEAYNEAGIWLAKKKYIKNTTWTEPNVYYDSCTKIKATGVEIAQTSSSPWVKQQLTNLVTWIFKEENFVFDNFVAEVTKVKKQFMRQNVDVVSVNKGMNKYQQYVLSDTSEIELQPKSMVTVQGAALYNWMLNNNEKYKKKYSMLMDSDKLCVVYIKPCSRYTYWKSGNIGVKEYLKHSDDYKLLSNSRSVTNAGEIYTDVLIKTQCEAFSYPAGMWPADMASNLEVDMDRMFNLLILGPINRIIEAMGYSPIDINMTFETSLW